MIWKSIKNKFIIEVLVAVIMSPATSIKVLTVQQFLNFIIPTDFIAF